MGESEITASSLFPAELDQASDELVEPFAYKHRISIIQHFLGFYFMIFAIIQLATNYSETSYRVALSCSEYRCWGHTGLISFSEDSPIYLYISSPRISQKNILEQINDPQNQGASCQLYSTNGQMGQPLISQNPAYPCGQFISYMPDIGLTLSDAQNRTIPIQNSDLTVFDIQYANSPSIRMQWIDVDSPRFKAWNQKKTAFGVNVYEGYIDSLTSNKLKVELKSANALHEKLREQIYVTLSDNGSLSGYNLYLCIIQFFGALLCFIFGCINCWHQQSSKSFAQSQFIHSPSNSMQINVKSPVGLKVNNHR